MSLKKRMSVLMEKYKIKPDSLLDQSFMIDDDLIKKIIAASGIKPGEIIVEIGAGIGFMSKELTRTGARIIAVEIDKKLEAVLKDELKGTGARIVCDNALDVIKKIRFDKIVSNTPYSICEPLVQLLTTLKFNKAFLSVPKGFAYRLLERKGIGLLAQAFFDINILFEIQKQAFKPEPRVNTVFISIEHRTADYYKENVGDFMLRELVLQKTNKLKNALMEAIINREKLFGKTITKRKSKEIIKNLNLSNSLLEQKIKDINLKVLADINKGIEICK